VYIHTNSIPSYYFCTFRPRTVVLFVFRFQNIYNAFYIYINTFTSTIKMCLYSGHRTRAWFITTRCGGRRRKNITFESDDDDDFWVGRLKNVCVRACVHTLYIIYTHAHIFTSYKNAPNLSYEWN